MKEELIKIGLSKYEVLCYITLLKFGELKGNEIALKANIPRTSAYPTLERLESKKFIYLKNQNPKSYMAVDPKLAIKSFVERKNKELEQEAKLAIKYLNTLSIDQNEKEGVRLLFGEEQSLRSAKESQKHITKEYLIMGDGLTKTRLLQTFSQFKEMREKGVKIYIITLPNMKKEAKEILTSLKNIGCEIGFYEIKNISFTISDRKKCSFGIKSKEFEGGRIVSSYVHKDFAQFQAERFFEIWEKAEKY